MSIDVITERMTASVEGEFCLFLIGMRINRPLKVHKWFPVARAMTRMLSELKANPALGYLGGRGWFGRTLIFVQYWRSVQHLMAYATDRNLAHAPAWAAFTRSVGDSGDVGIWHETYQVSPGSHESIYHNMPPFGLGAIGKLIPATGQHMNAHGRIHAARKDGSTSASS